MEVCPGQVLPPAAYLCVRVCVCVSVRRNVHPRFVLGKHVAVFCAIMLEPAAARLRS